MSEIHYFIFIDRRGFYALFYCQSCHIQNVKMNYVISDNFRIQEKQNHLLSQIEEVQQTRALQCSARKSHGSSYGHGLATVAVVGYTNAVSGFTIELCYQ